MGCNRVTVTCHFCLPSQINWGYIFVCISLRPLLIFFSHLYFGLPSYLFIPHFLTRLYIIWILQWMLHSSRCPWLDCYSNTWQRVIKHTVTHFPQLSSLLSLITKYSPPHPITRHPQSMLFHQYDRSSFKPIEKASVSMLQCYLNSPKQEIYPKI